MFLVISHFKCFKTSADPLSPSSTLSDQLITAQSNPLILQSTSFGNRYFISNQSNLVNANTLWWEHSNFLIQFFRSPCYVLLIDFNAESKAVWSSKKYDSSWKTCIIHQNLSRVAGFRESPTFIIFQDHEFFFASRLYFHFFNRHSHEYAVTSPFIFLTDLGTFLYCKLQYQDIQKRSAFPTEDGKTRFLTFACTKSSARNTTTVIISLKNRFHRTSE